MPDSIFEHPRLAQVYDPLDPDRRIWTRYVAIVDELARPIRARRGLWHGHAGVHASRHEG